MTSNIRLRAIRAAQVASLSATLVSTTACPGGPDNVPDAPAMDGFGTFRNDAFVTSDTGVDGGASTDAHVHIEEEPYDAPPATDVLVADTGAVADTGTVADAGPATDAGCTTFPPVTQACCSLEGGFWDEATMFCAIAVPGPFVPPAMNV